MTKTCLCQNTCTLSYQSTSVNTNIFGFEMVVEDFPRNSINLFYSDGSSTRKDPPLSRAKRGFYTPQSYTDSPTTPPWWGWWQSQTPPAETLTSAVPNTVWWWNTPPPPTTAGYNVSGRPAILPQSKTTSPISKLPLQFAFLGKSECSNGFKKKPVNTSLKKNLATFVLHHPHLMMMIFNI